MAADQSEKLLSRKSYDRDAEVIQSDEESDNNDFADGLGRSSEGDDNQVLQEDAEVEELLSKPGKFSALRTVLGVGNNGNPVKVSRKEERRQRHAEKNEKRRRRSSMGNEDAQLMFEMEEGNPETSSNPSTESLDVNRSKYASKQKHSRWKKMTMIHAIILVLFAGLGYGAYKASRDVHHIGLKLSTLSNGTHHFASTTILISLDGFRADFLNRNITPALNALVASGVSPRYMLPSFPSVTFPNHFTLVTGLYPESHGVVGNQFWDPALDEHFYYTHTKTSMQPRWWTAEPLWVTAEDQGLRTAIHMWPGSEAHIPDVEPTYVDKYNGSEVLPKKVERILGWLDLPGDDDEAAAGEELRPQFIAAYVPDVDADGHKYGPNSTEIERTISNVDSMLALLVEGLLARNLTEIVNIIVVSDHGMATTSTSRAIQLDDLIDLSLVKALDGWPLRGIRAKDPERDLPILHKQLLEAAAKYLDAFDVYTKETMPARYHFTNNDRIAPLWVVPRTGWAVVEKSDIDLAKVIASGEGVNPKGLHGYDHEHPLMRAIFVARGPAFPHTPNSRVPVFQNIEVYNIVCDSLGIVLQPNNGTLRLPLKTQGLHSDPDAPVLDTPHDPAAEPDIKTKPEDIDHEDLAAPPGFQDDKDYGGGAANNSNGEQEETKPQKSATNWWDFVHGQLEKLKEWAKEIVDGPKADQEATKGA